jgi:hypothetical protein
MAATPGPDNRRNFRAAGNALTSNQHHNESNGVKIEGTAGLEL